MLTWPTSDSRRRMLWISAPRKSRSMRRPVYRFFGADSRAPGMEPTPTDAAPAGAGAGGPPGGAAMPPAGADGGDDGADSVGWTVSAGAAACRPNTGGAASDSVSINVAPPAPAPAPAR